VFQNNSKIMFFSSMLIPLNSKEIPNPSINFTARPTHRSNFTKNKNSNNQKACLADIFLLFSQWYGDVLMFIAFKIAG